MHEFHQKTITLNMSLISRSRRGRGTGSGGRRLQRAGGREGRVVVGIKIVTSRSGGLIPANGRLNHAAVPLSRRGSGRLWPVETASLPPFLLPFLLLPPTTAAATTTATSRAIAGQTLTMKYHRPLSKRLTTAPRPPVPFHPAPGTVIPRMMTANGGGGG